MAEEQGVHISMVAESGQLLCYYSWLVFPLLFLTKLFETNAFSEHKKNCQAFVGEESENYQYLQLLVSKNFCRYLLHFRSDSWKQK